MVRKDLRDSTRRLPGRWREGMRGRRGRYKEELGKCGRGKKVGRKSRGVVKRRTAVRKRERRNGARIRVGGKGMRARKNA